MKSQASSSQSLTDQGLSNTLLLVAAGFCSFVIFAWPATLSHTPGFESEFLRHSQLLGKLDQQQLPPYSLWYLFQKLLIGSRLSTSTLSASGLLLIGAVATLKGVILTGLLRGAAFAPVSSLVGGILLGTAVALPLPFWMHISPLSGSETAYLGTIPANTFMSATQLVANVGALPAFYGLQQWCQQPTKKSFVVALSLCFIGSLAKPGIAPVFLIAICGCIVLRCWKSQRWQPQQTWQSLIAAALLLSPTVIISHFYLSGAGWKGIKAVFAPFVIWQAYSPNILVDLLRSFAFPIVVVVACVVQLRAESAASQRARTRSALVGLLPGILAASASVLVFICFAEQVDGVFKYSGNFIWAAISVNAGWHLNCLIATKSLTPPLRLAALGVLGLEAMGGFFYLSHYVSSGSYH